MAEQIDYRNNAQGRVKVALKDPDQGNALVTAQVATAEAVLALAEQQQIANLIALGIGTSSSRVRETLGLS